ncbi:hypothetical protein D3C86_1699650 [compost metagenome]
MRRRIGQEGEVAVGVRHLPAGQRAPQRMGVPQQTMGFQRVLGAGAGADAQTCRVLGVEPGAHQLGVALAGGQHGAGQRVRQGVPMRGEGGDGGQQVVHGAGEGVNGGIGPVWAAFAARQPLREAACARHRCSIANFTIYLSLLG